jgi:protein phosphatase
MSKINVKLAAGTDVGLVRQNNEDNFVVNADLQKDSWIIPQNSESITLGEYGTLLVVADGMGGTNAGEVASAIAIETIQQKFSPEELGKF